MLNGLSTRWMGIRIALLLGSAVAVLGCEQPEVINPFARTMTPHEAYTASLEEAGLTQTALGRSWLDAGAEVLDTAPPIPLPFREIRYLDPAQPTAVGYRFDLQRGQKLLINIDTEPGDTARVFVDLYEAPRDSTAPPRHLRSADSTRAITYNVRRSRTYLVRVQPELLHGRLRR